MSTKRSNLQHHATPQRDVWTTSMIASSTTSRGMTRVPDVPPEPVMETQSLNVFYGDFHAVHDVNLTFGQATRSPR